MPVTVRFPDGTERDVVSVLRSVSTGSGSRLVDVSQECADWRFVPLSAGKWMAVAKRRPPNKPTR